MIASLRLVLCDGAMIRMNCSRCGRSLADAPRWNGRRTADATGLAIALC
jgi:hypothetical protein